MRLIGLAFAGVLAMSCGGHVSDSSGSDASASGGDPTVSGTWTGYIESYKFLSGSDAMTMTLKGLTDGTVVGTVAFGNKPAPPPPTNPDVGYPPDLAGSDPRRFWEEGFAYTVQAGKLSGKRLTFGVSANELFKAWCELQTVIYSGGPSAPGSYGCLPNWGFSCCYPCQLANPDTKKMEPVDCGKLALCQSSSVCQCAATKCTVPIDGSSVTFDIVLAGEEANGSTTGMFGDRNVHLTRTK